MKSSRFLWHVGLCLSYEEDFFDPFHASIESMDRWVLNGTYRQTR